MDIFTFGGKTFWVESSLFECATILDKTLVDIFTF